MPPGTMQDDPAHDRRPFRLRLRTPEIADPDLPVWEEVVGDGDSERVIHGLGADDILTWAHHPDERFPIALADHAMAVAVSSEVRSRVSLKLWERGQAEADEEGHLWHPLFDAMDAGLGWPYTSAFDNEVERHEVSATSRARKLVPWIEAQGDPRKLEPLLTFRSSTVVRIVARHAPALDRSFVETALERDGELIDDLAINPALSNDLAAFLATRAAASLSGETDGGRVRGYGGSQDACAARTFSRLNEAGHPIPAEAVERLVDTLPRRRWGRQVVNAIKGAGANVRPEHYERLYRDLKKGSATWALLAIATAESPTARPIQRTLIREATGQRLFKLRKKMSATPGVRDDAEIREHLLDTTSKEVLLSLLAAFAGENEDLFSRAWGKLLSAQLSEAVSIVAGSGWEWQEDRRPDWTASLTNAHVDALLQRVAEYGSSRVLEDCFERVDGASEDPRLRHAYLEDGPRPPSNLLVLVQDARGEEMRTVFRRLVASWPHQALEVLEKDESPPGLADLRAEDVVPLLQADRSRVRQRALLATSQLEFAPVPSARQPVQEGAGR